MSETPTQHADTERSCCPFQTTPGRMLGRWTDCIHGLVGRKNELLRELQEIEDRIFLWQTENPRG